MTLGQRIQKGRNRLGLSQEGLGERLGVSRQAVSKWEADGAVPDTDKLIALSRLFGMSLNTLLQVETPETAAPSVGSAQPVVPPRLERTADGPDKEGAGRQPGISGPEAEHGPVGPGTERRSVGPETGHGRSAGPGTALGTDGPGSGEESLRAGPDSAAAQPEHSGPERTPEAQAVPSENVGKGQRHWAHRLAAVAVGALLFFLTAAVIGQEMRLRELERQAAQQQIIPYQLSVSNFEANLLSGYGLSLDLILAELRDDLRVEFSVADARGEVQSCVANRQDGGHFLGELPMKDLWEPLTISTMVTTGGCSYAQALMRIDSFRAHGFTWESLWN